MKKIIYVLGNPLVETDSLPTSILPSLAQKLPHLLFTPFDPTEELPSQSLQNLILVDTVLGIEEVTSFTDLNLWRKSPRVTAHDFDLPVSLGLLQKLGKLKSVHIIGIPPKADRKRVIRQVVNILKAI